MKKQSFNSYCHQVVYSLIVGFVVLGLGYDTISNASEENPGVLSREHVLGAIKSKREIDPAVFKSPYGEEVIIKFVEQTGLAFAEELFKSDHSFESITGSSKFDELKEKYQITSLKRVFKKPQNVPFGLTLSKQVDKNEAIANENMLRNAYEDRVEQVKEKFQRRSQRAPAHSRIPHVSTIYRLKLGQQVDIEMVCRELSELSYVEYAVENHRHQLHYDPNDTYYASAGSWGQSYDDLYALKTDKLNCEGAWDLSFGQQTIVAVVDTGVDQSHLDLMGNIWENTGEVPDNGIDDDGNGYVDDISGYDFSDDDPDPSDYMGHGSHCAGTIAAIGGNSQGIIGVAPKTQIMCLKGFPNATDDVLAEAIQYAADNGADVISNSWGPTGVRPSSPVLEAAIDYAHALGCMLVFSAGNANDDVANYSPANYTKTIAVAATDSSDQKASFSNYGFLIDVSAPGVEILSLRALGTDMYEVSTGYTSGERFVPEYDPLAQYYRANGTSMSAPHVAGLAALLINAYPGVSNDLLAGRIIGSTDQIETLNPNYHEQLGSGRINAYSALTISESPHIKLAEYEFGTGITPGVTSDLVLSFVNKWVLAEQVDVTVSSTDSYVTILQANSQYGDLDTNIPKDNSSNPFVVSIDGTAPYGHTIEFSITLNAVGYQKSYSLTTDVGYSNLPGWPVDIPNRYASRAPTLFDIDHDGKEEVIIGGVDFLYVFNEDGTACTGWPQSVGSGHLPWKHVAGDIDGDGDHEIVAIVNQRAGVNHTSFYAWHSENGVLVDGWPIHFSRDESEDLALADMDGNPTDLEVIIVKGPSALFVLQGNGTNLSGWPVDLPVNRFKIAGLAVGNIDNVPGNEIVVSTGRMPRFDYKESPVFVYRQNGTPMPGWPIMTNGYCNPPVICNLDDNEDDIEIVVGSVTDSTSGKIYAWKYNGQTVPGWPVSANTYGTSVGDINNDGLPEILGRGSWPDVLRAFSREGQLLWSKSLSPWTIPSIVDLDGDNYAEIIFGTSAGDYLYVVDHLGNFKPGFPITLNDKISNHQPAIGDINGDGTLEIVAINSNERIYVYDMLGPDRKHKQWPMSMRNAQATSFYSIPEVYLADFNGDGKVDVGDLGIFASYWLSPCDDFFGDERDWCFGTDLTQSTKVDFADFAIFSNDWEN